MYPRSGPLSHTRTTSLSFSYYFNCICNDYNAQSSNNIIIHLNLCLQMVSGKWREMLETCTKTLMCKQPRHACLRCSCLKHACLDLLCKRALRVFSLKLIYTKLTKHNALFNQVKYGDVSITDGGLQIVAYTQHSWSLRSDGSLACNIFCDSENPFIMVIFRGLVTLTPFVERLVVERGAVTT